MLINWYLLLKTYYQILVTWYFLPHTCYMILVSLHLFTDTCFLIYVGWYLLTNTYYFFSWLVLFNFYVLWGTCYLVSWYLWLQSKLIKTHIDIVLLTFVDAWRSLIEKHFLQNIPSSYQGFEINIQNKKWNYPDRE